MVVDDVTLLQYYARLLPLGLRVDARETLLRYRAAASRLLLSLHVVGLALHWPIDAANAIHEVLKRRFEAILSLFLWIPRLIMPPHPIAALWPQFDGLKYKWIRTDELNFARLQIQQGYLYARHRRLFDLTNGRRPLLVHHCPRRRILLAHFLATRLARALGILPFVKL